MAMDTIVHGQLELLIAAVQRLKSLTLGISKGLGSLVRMVPIMSVNLVKLKVKFE